MKPITAIMAAGAKATTTAAADTSAVRSAVPNGGSKDITVDTETGETPERHLLFRKYRSC